jgi:hypothetical protein
MMKRMRMVDIKTKAKEGVGFGPDFSVACPEAAESDGACAATGEMKASDRTKAATA